MSMTLPILARRSSGNSSATAFLYQRWGSAVIKQTLVSSLVLRGLGRMIFPGWRPKKCQHEVLI